MKIRIEETSIHRLTEREKNISRNRTLFQKIQDRWLQKSEHMSRTSLGRLSQTPTCTRMQETGTAGRLKISWIDVLRSKKKKKKGFVSKATKSVQLLFLWQTKVSPYRFRWRSGLRVTMLSSAHNNHLAKYSNVPKPIIQQVVRSWGLWVPISILSALE